MSRLRRGWMLAILLLCVACGSVDPNEQPSNTATTVPGDAQGGSPPAAGPPQIRGTASAVQVAGAKNNQTQIGSLLVEGPLEDGTTYDRAMVRITSETRIFEQRGGERVAVDAEALADGQQVEAWFSGPVAESYPVQATAGTIVILQ